MRNEGTSFWKPSITPEEDLTLRQIFNAGGNATAEDVHRMLEPHGYSMFRVGLFLAALEDDGMVVKGASGWQITTDGFRHAQSAPPVTEHAGVAMLRLLLVLGMVASIPVGVLGRFGVLDSQYVQSVLAVTVSAGIALLWLRYRAWRTENQP